MCNHKRRLSENDKKFLKSIKIEPYDCNVCERIAEVDERKVRLRIEKPDNDDDEAQR